MKIKRIKNIKEKLITLGAIAVLVVVMYILNITCFFKFLFGIPCPGCGITRACIALLHLDFATAFQYNPMVWSVPILVLLYLFDGQLFQYKWLNNLIMVGIFLGFIVSWICKLF